LFFATVCNLLAVMMVYKVSDRHSTILLRPLTDRVFSTGTVSQKKTLSSV
jgi:hypothetical protein